MYATSSPDIQFAVSGTMDSGICESLIMMVKQASTVIKWQWQAKITDLTFTAPDEEITNLVPIN